MHLTGELSGHISSHWTFTKGAGAMVTYTDLFTFVIMLCAIITLVITCCRHKK